MTTPHIEAIARAILKRDGVRSDRDIDTMRDSRSFVYKYTIAEATLAFTMSAEICAGVADDAAKYQDDCLCAGTIERLADAIRALIQKEVG